MSTIEVDQLYQAFSRYPRPDRLNGCPCCTDEEASQALIRVRLRDLPASALSHYAFKALSTWGVLDDFRYFLPRILELTRAGMVECDTEVILGKLGYADWMRWPDDEQAAVRRFVASFWGESIRTGQHQQADSILCGVANSLSDIGWLIDLADSVDPRFRIVYGDEHGRADKRRLTNSFWNRSLPSYRQALDWVYPQGNGKAQQ